MIRRFPIAAAILALSLTTSASMAAEGNQLSQDDEQLKSALAGAPVIVTLQVASVTLTSSADAMFPSGGWQIPSDSPLLNKMLPTFSKLRNTSIVVEGCTANCREPWRKAKACRKGMCKRDTDSLRLTGCGKSRHFGKTAMKRACAGNSVPMKSTGCNNAIGDELGWKHRRSTFSAAC
jgi:hypothetical protein